MDTLGTEVGQKMRSAVKAKLIELGTGSSSGYIDDELPDYVMIMVANKRSKKQMLEDLNLFLGENTEIFVNWLHQVLEKLQEVTLPATLVQKSSNNTKVKSSGDHKKVKSSKEKSRKKSQRDKTPDLSEEEAPVPSITDVFADHLIGKAKRSLEIESQNVPVKKKESKSNKETTRKEFDIPTISDIAKAAVVNAKRKELEELEEIQKQINEAKRQLSSINQESEDEDFLNLKADENDGDYDDEDSLLGANNEIRDSQAEKETVSEKRHSPIVFNNNFEKSSNSEIEQIEESKTPPRKPPVKNRLGVRTEEKKSENIISLSAHRKMEREIYIPAFRRDLEKNKEPEKPRDRSRSRERRDRREFRPRSRERREERPSQRLTRQSSKERREARDRDRRRERDDSRNGKRSPERITRRIPEKVEDQQKLNVKQRIGSRVIVAPAKPQYEEEEIEVPVNSVVKIKPRPVIPTNKQANKNLLLRAVAEAQKSIANTLSKQLEPPKLNSRPTVRPESAKSRLGRRSAEGISKEVPKKKILIEIPQDQNHHDVEEEEDLQIEKITVQNCDDFEQEAEKEEPGPDTQFVVTLDGMYKKTDQRKNVVKEDKIQVQVITKNRMEITNVVKATPPTLLKESPRKLEKTPPSIKSRLNLNYTKSPEKPLAVNTRKRKSPIRFESPKARKSEVREAEKKPDREEPEAKRQKSETKEDTIKLKRIKSTESMEAENGEKKEPNKYDNLPSLLSAVTVVKPMDRCKYFPNCGKGDTCEFYHPTTNCKSFPNCKFGDKCMYLHPKCKFDLTCIRPDCNFSHTPVATAAPPLASHVVPVQNYKTITPNPLPPLCKFYPKCSNILCPFYHPKFCRFGKNCINKIECNFYHHDLPTPDKFKWVSPTTG